MNRNLSFLYLGDLKYDFDIILLNRYIDIDQLTRVLSLVGTPNQKLLDKIYPSKLIKSKT